MIDFVVITDTHFTSVSRVRNGNVLDDLCKKLKFTVDYCITHNAVLLHAGDVFDKPTVPDFVKSRLAEVLKPMWGKIYCISGNHDRLYDNPEYNFKTSYNVWSTHGIIKDLDSSEGVDFGDCIVSSQVPIITRGKPQIVIFHGFLNIEDGRNTFRFQDIQTQDNTFIVLGHDHTVYEPIDYGESIKIFRPGSFLRCNRQETNQRIPQLLHIRCSDGKLKYKYVPIELARPWEEVFKPKELKITKSQQSAVYDDIVNQIRNAQATDLTLDSALNQVTTPDVVEYCMNVLEECKLNNNFKAK